jgi:hypothetical protein
MISRQFQTPLRRKIRFSFKPEKFALSGSKVKILNQERILSETGLQICRNHIRVLYHFKKPSKPPSIDLDTGDR